MPRSPRTVLYLGERYEGRAEPEISCLKPLSEHPGASYGGALHGLGRRQRRVAKLGTEAHSAASAGRPLRSVESF